MLEYIHGMRSHVQKLCCILKENVQQHKQVGKQCRQKSHRSFRNGESQWRIVCVDRAASDSNPFELRETFSLPTADNEDCLGAHSYQACVEQCIQTLEVDVNISSPAVTEAWKAPRNKMKRTQSQDEVKFFEKKSSRRYK